MEEKLEVATFNADTLKETITEKIKKDFINMIPDDAFKNLVQTEIDWLFERTEKGSYENKRRTSPFQEIVREELTDLFKKRITEELQKAEYMDEWNCGKHNPGEAVKQIVKELAPDLVASLFSGLVQTTVGEIRENMQRASPPSMY